jgi:hypothetical protein
VNVLDNPSYFQNPLQFEIQYECLHDLQHGARRLCLAKDAPLLTTLCVPHECCRRLKCVLCSVRVCSSGGTLTTCCARPTPADLEWKLIYVGSAESEKYDQVLDSVLVGPVVPGQYRFVFQVRVAASTPHNLPPLPPCTRILTLLLSRERLKEASECERHAACAG